MENGSDTTTALVEALHSLPTHALFGGRVLGGIRDFTPADLKLRPAELRIVHQRRSRNDVGEPGQLRLGKRLFDTLECVFLGLHRYRVLAEGEGEGRRNVCASGDNLMPLVDLRTPKARACNERLSSGYLRPVCAYACWDDDPVVAGKRTPPQCTEGIVFMGLTLEAPPAVFWFPCSKTARIDAQSFVDELEAIPGVEHITQFRVRVSTQEKRSKSGGVVWYGPVFSAGTLEPELAEPARRLADKIGDVRWIPFVRQDEPEDEEAPPIEGADVETTATPVAGRTAADSGIPF